MTIKQYSTYINIQPNINFNINIRYHDYARRLYRK